MNRKRRPKNKYEEIRKKKSLNRRTEHIRKQNKHKENLIQKVNYNG